eukprot:gene11832-5162_t
MSEWLKNLELSKSIILEQLAPKMRDYPQYESYTDEQNKITANKFIERAWQECISQNLNETEFTAQFYQKIAQISEVGKYTEADHTKLLTDLTTKYVGLLENLIKYYTHFINAMNSQEKEDIEFVQTGSKFLMYLKRLNVHEQGNQKKYTELRTVRDKSHKLITKFNQKIKDNPERLSAVKILQAQEKQQNGISVSQQAPVSNQVRQTNDQSQYKIQQQQMAQQQQQKMYQQQFAQHKIEEQKKVQKQIVPPQQPIIPSQKKQEPIINELPDEQIPIKPSIIQEIDNEIDIDKKLLIIQKINKFELENDTESLNRLNILQESFKPILREFSKTEKKRKFFETIASPKLIKKKKKLEKYNNLSYLKFLEDCENLTLIKHENEEKNNFYFEYQSCFNSNSLFFHFKEVDSMEQELEQMESETKLSFEKYSLKIKEFNKENEELINIQSDSSINQIIEKFESRNFLLNQMKREINFLLKNHNNVNIDISSNISSNEIKIILNFNSYIHVPSLIINFNEKGKIFEFGQVDQDELNFHFLNSKKEKRS